MELLPSFADVAELLEERIYELQPTEEFVRHFRIVELPYDEPPKAIAGVHARGFVVAMAAENALREKLMAGVVPTEVALIAPEFGCLSDIDAHGRLREPMCAWLASAWQEPGSPYYRAAYLGHGIAVHAVIESDSFLPDPASAEWAAAGSFALDEGRITRLNLPAWLRPVAALLANTYGVEVAIYGKPIELEFIESEPVVFEGVFNADEIASLRAYLPGGPLAEDGGSQLEAGGLGGYKVVEESRREGCVDLTTPPLELVLPLIAPLLERAGEHFGVPANGYLYRALTYWPESGHLPHVDRNPELEPASWSRTVSLSILLNEPDEDFTGGEFETPYGVVPLRQGDCVAITSMTPHWVNPVDSGTREVLVVFGSWDGWNS